MGDSVLEPGAGGISLVDMGGIQVPGNSSKQVDVGLRDGFGHAGALSNLIGHGTFLLCSSGEAARLTNSYSKMLAKFSRKFLF